MAAEALLAGFHGAIAGRYGHRAKLDAELQLLGIRVDRTSIAKLESGRRPAIDIEIVAIARVLNVPIPKLFENSDRFFRQLDIVMVFNLPTVVVKAQDERCSTLDFAP